MTATSNERRAETPKRPTNEAAAEARAILQQLVVELARIAAAEDDAAERRRDMATPCSTR
jgi:hypothetical protein